MLTPGRLISAVPLNDTPPIVLAVCNAVAVPALPLILPVTSADILVIPDIAVQYNVPNFSRLLPKFLVAFVDGIILVST